MAQRNSLADFKPSAAHKPVRRSSTRLFRSPCLRQCRCATRDHSNPALGTLTTALGDDPIIVDAQSAPTLSAHCAPGGCTPNLWNQAASRASARCFAASTLQAAFQRSEGTSARIVRMPRRPGLSQDCPRRFTRSCMSPQVPSAAPLPVASCSAPAFGQEVVASGILKPRSNGEWDGAYWNLAQTELCAPVAARE